MRIKNTHDLNTLLLEISRLHSYTSLGLSLNNEMSLSLLFSRSVDMPVLSVIPPPHVRSTGVRDGWILCNGVVRSVTSILLPSFPTEPQGTGTHASRKSKRHYILWVYCTLSILVPRPDCFRERYPVVFWVGSQCKGHWFNLMPRPWSNTRTDMHVCVCSLVHLLCSTMHTTYYNIIRKN